MRTADQIRQDFLSFFEGQAHTVVPSAPVIPHGDPTLLFTNAGMNQFKDVFLGQGTRDYTRAADTQKCIRVSGKHNDLEEVGRDGYHHTFFEMLGNWSFGDYYKREAILWAWTLLTDVWGLPKDRLFATVYKDDDEALELWDEVTDIGRDRILRFDEKDNFWEMGETGPCGPCSEIHYDRTPDKSGVELVNAGVPEVMEIWNLVFIQYDRQADGSLVALPATHVDTGMGFERIVSVLQNTVSNYDTDIFAPIIEAIASVTGTPYSPDEKGIPHQVIADHIRMLTFAISDGALPSNLGRGYVLRRVLRRASRFGRKLGMHGPFLCRLVPAVVDRYGQVFPELREQTEHVRRVIEAEEKSFDRTLDRGMQLFDDAVRDLAAGSVISGEVVFKLYDTFGFPVDMTGQMGEERELGIDVEGYERELARQKARSRDSAKFQMASDDSGDWIVIAEGDGTFVGYDAPAADARIMRYRMVDDAEADGQLVQFVLDRTPFYAESGGQVGDRGQVFRDGLLIDVCDVRKVEGHTVHVGRIREGEIQDAAVRAEIDVARREATRRNHTATHLLHRALRETLGEHVQQRGSLVDPERLRFDFSHYEGMTPEEVRAVEARVNEQIRADLALDISHRPIDEAKASGATALFGETYGDIVRVVKAGEYTIELCGGTHCDSTGQIGLCMVLSEGSISAGIRRIEALTGAAAYEYVRAQADTLAGLAGGLRCGVGDVTERVDGLAQRVKDLQRENTELHQAGITARMDELMATAADVEGVRVLAAQVEAAGMDDLKTMAEALRQKMGSGVAVLGAAADGKAMLIAMATKDLIEKGVHAGNIIRPIARIAGGGGGGQPHVAQAGGKSPEKLGEAIAAVPDIVREQLAG